MATVAEARKSLLEFKKALPYAVLRGLRKGLPIAVRIIKTRYMERKDNRHPFKTFDPPNPPPGPLGIRSGALARSVHVGGDFRYDGRRILGTIEAGDPQVPYAGVHEFGGTIYAKNGPFLRFPMGFPGGFYMVKKPSVKIPARPYMRPGLEEATPIITEIVLREIKTVARVTLKGMRFA